MLNCLKGYIEEGKCSVIQRIALPLMFVLLLLTGCDNVVKDSIPSSDIRPSNDSVITYNKQMVKTENQEIEDFIKRYKWKMKQTPTGLRYMIYRLGKGPTAAPGNQVKIDYSVRLLTGEEIYNSKELGSKEIIIGKREIETGVEEGLLMLRTGDKAKLIVPSHLAHGLLGDLKKIPERSALVYEIEILKISPKY